jgi:general secretion pathway protein G
MDVSSKKAFTMIELVFVIVVIGILSAIAIPKFAATRDDAIITKARTTVASVRSALSTERQKRILKGEFADINKSAIGNDSNKVFTNLLEYPAKVCSGTSARNCWIVGGTETTPTYTFREPDGTEVKFTLESNRLNCKINCDNFE